MSRSFVYSSGALRLVLGCLIMTCVSETLAAQQAFNWQQIRAKFETSNPTLRAGEIGIAESRAQEITAFLRPNPDLTMAADGTQFLPYNGGWHVFQGTLYTWSVSYLHERQSKRELRRDSAQKGTAVAVSQLADQERTLLFTLRGAFVQTLQAKAILELSQENLTYYDRVLSVSRDRFSAGDIAKVDLDRLELQRVQYQQDLETSIVNLRTAKIQLLTLLNDRTPIEQFDITGPFDFMEQIAPQDEFRRMAQEARPDLRAAVQAVEKAQTDHRLAIANASVDPTFSGWITHNASFNNPFDFNTLGVSVSLPLRFFDRGQGEKLRTQLDIGRNTQLVNATVAQVFSDVDSAYVTVQSNINLLRTYKEQYLAQSLRVRDTISFSYQQGAASLLDFLNAQNDYRTTQRGYLTLIGSYLTAAAQLNLAVGREVIQ
jgi:cobalt-zinc-cadmium efflux system outer membrane protein